MSKVSSPVAIIGGGPGGPVAAGYLRRHRLDPVIFEATEAIGGQWNLNAPHSGVWRGMRTNSSRVMTSFSDLAYETGVPVYPTGEHLSA